MEFAQNPSLGRFPVFSWASLGLGAVLVTAAVGVFVAGEGASPGNLLPGSPTTSLNNQSGDFSATPTWEQDFSKMPDGPVDPQTWKSNTNPDVPGWNDEAQAYTDKKENVRIEKGKLVIQARKQNYQYPNDPEKRSFKYTSGRIETFDSSAQKALPNGLTFEYGKAEIEMRIPAYKGTWPAFWLLSSNQPKTDSIIAQATKGLEDAEAEAKSDELWNTDGFYKHDGEIDIMEHFGNYPGIIEGTVHTFNGPSQGIEGSKQLSAKAPEAFHRYGIEVTPSKIVWTLDGKPYFTYQKSSDNPDDWPFGQGNQLYMILNLALGGDAGEIDSKMISTRLEVKKITFQEYISTKNN